MSKLSLTARKLSGKQEVQTVVTLASSIVHEIKNYLTAISICSELSGMQLENIRKKVRSADYIIGNLQLQIKGIVTGETNPKDFKCYSIARNIKESLEQYPFQEGERELITLDLSKDFKYKGNPALTAHIVYNLLKNALRAITNADKGTISIRLEPASKLNKLIFRDTASGIAKEFLPKIFRLFESQMTEQGGTGVGLAFCKVIMKSYGGDITCNSILGKYTEFVLSFPRIF